MESEFGLLLMVFLCGDVLGFLAGVFLVSLLQQARYE